ncbi:MAG: glycosyltransferase family 4 protein [Xanthomonadales bacterium]|nr:glycosyltransferase family 4 protein [Xanthomonadales bacterium]
MQVMTGGQQSGPGDAHVDGRPLRILFLTDNFPPEVNAPASRTHEHARVWVRTGAKVTVITCAPNFPTGKVFPGYRNRLWQRESIDGIEVIRVWTYITANEGFARRILDYLSFMVSAAIAGVLQRRFDVVVGTSPQFFTACAAWFVGWVRRRPFVFELRDLWPESIKAVGAMQASRAIAWLERIEWFLYRRATRIVSVTQSFRQRLIDGGIPASKLAVVTNGADLSRYQPCPKDPQLLQSLGLDGAFVAGYIGTHGMAHALETLLEAAARWNEAESGPLRLLLVGDGAQKPALRQQALEMGLGERVVFVDTVPKDEIARYWSVLDACIVHLRRTPLFETVIPSKLFESMAMGVPVLLGVAGEVRTIVEQTACGLPFTPEDPAALLAVMQQLAADEALRQQLSEAGVRGARHFDREHLAGRMLSVLRGTVPER